MIQPTDLRRNNIVQYFDDEFSTIQCIDHGYCHLNNASSIEYEN